MNKDTIALIISITSMIVALLSLSWNIYRDIVLKAKLKVRCMVSFISSPAFEKPLERVIISATNFGPGKIRLAMLFLKDTSFWTIITRKRKYAALIHDYTDPLSGKLPCELEVGEGRDYLFRFDKDCFLSERWTHIGVKDSFGRIHWAPKSNVKTAKQMYKDKFTKK